jgi:hypothetical protein
MPIRRQIPQHRLVPPVQAAGPTAFLVSGLGDKSPAVPYRRLSSAESMDAPMIILSSLRRRAVEAPPNRLCRAVVQGGAEERAVAAGLEGVARVLATCI